MLYGITVSVVVFWAIMYLISVAVVAVGLWIINSVSDNETRNYNIWWLGLVLLIIGAILRWLF